MEIHFVLITLGGLFLIGLATDELGRRTRLPRVTLLMLFGVTIASTIVFEIFGPILTQIALKRVGEHVAVDK